MQQTVGYRLKPRLSWLSHESVPVAHQIQFDLRSKRCGVCLLAPRTNCDRVSACILCPTIIIIDAGAVFGFVRRTPRRTKPSVAVNYANLIIAFFVGCWFGRVSVLADDRPTAANTNKE